MQSNANLLPKNQDASAYVNLYIRTVQTRIGINSKGKYVNILFRWIDERFFDNPLERAIEIYDDVCKGRMVATRKCYLGVLRRFADWCCRRGLVPADVVDILQPPIVCRTKRPDTLTFDQCRDLMKHAMLGCLAKWSAHEFTVLMLLSLHAGLRANEALLISTDEIHMKEGIISLQETKFRSLKTWTATRKIPMSNLLETFIEICMDGRKPGELLFRQALGPHQQPFDRWNAPHKFTATLGRHTFASALAAGGIGTFRLMYLMGHSDVQTTTNYYIGESDGVPDLHPLIFEKGPGIIGGHG